MAVNKRPLEDGPDSDSLHPSRKRRLEHSKENTEVATILGRLTDNAPNLRQEASRELLVKLSEKPHLLEYALTRLIKGLCSDRKAARLGFSIALVEVLHLDRATTNFSSLRSLVDQIITLTRPEGNATGQERRSSLLGQRSAYHAVLLSDILPKASEDDSRYFFDVLAALAAEKQWLRSECLAILHEYLSVSEQNPGKEHDARRLIDSWEARGLLKTPEGVALWLSVRDAFPQVKLPKGLWHHNNPLSSQDRPQLSKIMLDAFSEDDHLPSGMPKKKGGARQSTPSSAWNIIMSHLYVKSKGSDLAAFWAECVAKKIFTPSTSAERKALGLQIFSQSLQTAPTSLLEHIIHPNIIRCILDQRAKAGQSLFEAAKLPLDHMVARGKRDPAAASKLVSCMAAIVPGNLDQLTKKTLEALLSASDLDGLHDAATAIVELCWNPGVDDTSKAEQKRRMLADLLLTSVRGRRAESAHLFSEQPKKGLALAPWLNSTLEGLVNLAYRTAEQPTSPVMTEPSRQVFCARLMSCLGELLDRPLEQAVLAPSIVTTALHSSRKHLVSNPDEKTVQAIKEARKLEKALVGTGNADNGPQVTSNRAFQLLLSLSMLEAYNQEPESLGVLEDLVAYYQTSDDDKESSTTLIELLLSFVSKESALFRKLSEQVFSAFAPDVARDGLQSMIDILQQKEGLSGQQELFDQHDDKASEDASDNEEGIDVEEDSDLELVNGEVVHANGDADDVEEDSASNSGSDSSEDDSEPGEEDEETAFDRMLADALGTSGMNYGSDDDGSDMDDDQMMALDSHLTTIFKERKTGSSKKQENKDAKQNMIHFKTRVLDLLKKYVESQYANSVALDLIIPLTTLIRTTSSKAVAEKAFNNVLKPYFDACGKHKKYPVVDDEQACLAVLQDVHDEMELGGSKMHASACSRASLFLAKILVTRDGGGLFDEVDAMYFKLHSKWYLDPKSKVHSSIFTDWMSWTISTRKHA